jgi:hypothetical protein
MGEHEIREKYGGKLPKAINRAIRAEVPGGNEALDKLTQLAGAARHSRWTDHAGRDTAEALAYFKHKREVVDRMDAEVRRRWGVPPDKPGRSDPANRSGGPNRPGQSNKAGGHRPGAGRGPTAGPRSKAGPPVPRRPVTSPGPPPPPAGA